MVKTDRDVKLAWALDPHTLKQILPAKGRRGVCPYCGAPVISKCGAIVTDHFAHEGDCDCPSFHFGDAKTAEHVYWQSLRTPNIIGETVEVRKSTDTTLKVADIVCANGRVLEVQCSPMDTTTRLERERHYGESMQWLIPRKQLGSKTFYRRIVEYDFQYCRDERDQPFECGSHRILATHNHPIYVYDKTHVSCIFCDAGHRRVIDKNYNFSDEWDQIVLPHSAFARLVINDSDFDPSKKKYLDIMKTIHDRVVRRVNNHRDVIRDIYMRPLGVVVCNSDGTLNHVVEQDPITIFTLLERVVL